MTPRKTIRWRSVLAPLLIAATASGCGWSGLNENPLPFAAGNGDDALTVTVHMANAVNLVPNSEVKVNDVTVGSVRRIAFADWHARLTLGLEPDVRLPENTVARIGQKSLLGAEYLELAPPTSEQPHGTLSDGAVIPLSRTGRYPETEELFAALATVLNGGGLGQIGTITAELNNAFNGREQDVRQLVEHLGALIGALDEQRAKIVAATAGVNELAATFADDRETLSEALETLPRAVDVLRDEREDLTDTLDQLAKFGDSTTTLLTTNRVKLRRNLENL
ncbi:MAG TPA: MCE family protein, partial [Aeromicrobium sp.]|nr:MCE family protein [Aeromicrobium sp.]